LELVCFEGAELLIGDGTYINYGTNISARASTVIGRNCNIGQYCIVMDSDFHSIDDHLRPDDPEPVRLGDDVWLGARVIVLKGAVIGDGATIGANSVVRGVIPAGAVAAGNPARVLRMPASQTLSAEGQSLESPHSAEPPERDATGKVGHHSGAGLR
jgi:acetyltransferase-like isoleucine patch superfamily enzyme